MRGLLALRRRCKMAVEQVLKIRDLRIESISGLCLVNNISLELKRGEVLGLIGESGAGKSTIGIGAMAYTRAGCRITGGTVEIDGVSIRDLTSEGRREQRGQHIAYIAQSAAASFNPSSARARLAARRCASVTETITAKMIRPTSPVSAAISR